MIGTDKEDEREKMKLKSPNSCFAFEKLTPKKDANLGIYKDALDYVFNNDDITNIAITGPYSSGKSSVINTYENQSNSKKYIHISLAHFDDSINIKDKSPNTEKENPEESLLEGKIMNQLIHQLSKSKLKQSNFNIKSNIDINTIKKEAVLFVLYIVFIIDLSLFLKQHSLSSFAIVLFMIDLLFVVSISIFYVFHIIKIQKERNIFRSLSLKGNEIKLFSEDNDSYFDKYLNEVVYLFENCEAEAVIFEDMDRYEANLIFERLREVNTLVNLHIKKNNPLCGKNIKFFYLLRDDIFISKDRTKFFDFIVPIIPVVDSSNSYNQLKKILQKNSLFDIKKISFYKGISLYIDDMRLLKNICNEYIMYFDKLKGTDLDKEKMFAIIVYKNIFPQDFSNLQLNMGYVYTIFSRKNEWIGLKAKSLETKIFSLEEDLKKSKQERLKNIEELDTVFMPKRIRNSGTKYNEKNQKEYDERKNIIERFDEINSKKYTHEINKLKHQLDGMNSLYQNIDESNSEKIFDTVPVNGAGNKNKFEDVKSSNYSDLLKYLISNGSIDETYQDYMTYFYENSLKQNDKIFIRSVKDRKRKEFNYKLYNPMLIISYLDKREFYFDEILNFDLINYLLKYENEQENKELLRFFVALCG